VPGDDVRKRLEALPRITSAAVRALGTEQLTLRVDLVDESWASRWWTRRRYL
jgi:hypothetical protein